MTRGDLLIVGSGGYVRSVVLPEVKAQFPNWKIGLASRRGAKALTLALQEGLQPLNALDEMRNYERVFLADSPLEFADLITILSPNAHLWIEKPVSACHKAEFARIQTAVVHRNASVYIGLNKRQFLLTEPIVSILNSQQPLEAELDFPIEWNESIAKTLWKDYLIEGGVLWTDGIHALDMATEIAGTGASISVIEFQKTRWKFEVRAGNRICRVTIGAVDRACLSINGQDMGDFTSGKKSRDFFRGSFAQFAAGNSNLKSALESHEKWISVLSPLLDKNEG